MNRYIETAEQPLQVDVTKGSKFAYPVADMRTVAIQARGGATYPTAGLLVKRSLDGANAVDFGSAVAITADGITVVDVTDTTYIHIEVGTGGSPSGTAELVIWAHDIQP